jgi:hypothetical protein
MTTERIPILMITALILMIPFQYPRQQGEVTSLVIMMPWLWKRVDGYTTLTFPMTGSAGFVWMALNQGQCLGIRE